MFYNHKLSLSKKVFTTTLTLSKHIDSKFVYFYKLFYGEIEQKGSDISSVENYFVSKLLKKIAK